jgi:hypothetical protein
MKVLVIGGARRDRLRQHMLPSFGEGPAVSGLLLMMRSSRKRASADG